MYRRSTGCVHRYHGDQLIGGLRLLPLRAIGQMLSWFQCEKCSQDTPTSLQARRSTQPGYTWRMSIHACSRNRCCCSSVQLEIHGVRKRYRYFCLGQMWSVCCCKATLQPHLSCKENITRLPCFREYSSVISCSRTIGREVYFLSVFLQSRIRGDTATSPTTNENQHQSCRCYLFAFSRSIDASKGSKRVRWL